ncbi:UNVERIFIED_CONTAM: hypothetical protein FKN15_041308 [Acipenser sinensis]
MKRESGRKVQTGNISAAKTIADVIRTCLGPRAMMKMLLDPMGGIVMTNDGNAILREIQVQHPAAKSMIEISRTQDEEVGDGTTSVIILGGIIEDSCVLRGVMVNKDVTHPRMRRMIKNPRIVLLDCSLEYKKGESQTDIEITREEDFARILQMEEEYIQQICEDIIRLKPDLIFTEKGISGRERNHKTHQGYYLAQHYLMKANITAIRRVRKTDNNRIARACGAHIASRTDELREEDVGTGAGLFEIKKIGDEYFTFITECKDPKACTIILRGASKEILAEVERNLQDAMQVCRNVLIDPSLVPGGGAAEMAVSHLLTERSKTMTGVEQWPYRAVAQALEVIPRTLIQNCGASTIRVLTSLRAKHTQEGSMSWGVNGETGALVDMKELGIWEPLAVKAQTYKTAVEVSLELNPDPSGSSNVSVLHVRAVGGNDTLHFLWGSQGVPTLLLVHTDSPETRVQIDWARMLSNNISGSLTVEPASAVRYSTAFLFTKIWEYRDNSTDQSQAAADSYFPPYSLEEFTWEDLNRTLNHSALTAQLCGRNQSQHRGRVCFQCKLLPAALRRHSPASPPLPPPRLGLALAFFGGALDQGYRASAVNISFGIPGEPFYNATGYLSWSCLLGLGSPPEDSFSPLVLGIMVVGLGTPALLLLVGGAYVCVRRLRRQQPGYAPIS